MPNVPNLHQMRGAAGDNEDGKARQHAVDGDILSFAPDTQQQDEDRSIGKGDQRIGGDLKPDKRWRPEITMPWGHKGKRAHGCAGEFESGRGTSLINAEATQEESSSETGNTTCDRREMSDMTIPKEQCRIKEENLQ